MLKMKKACEKCNAGTPPTACAFICSYECTYCENCATAMSYICPNCSGNLVQRPFRTVSPLQALSRQVNRKLFGREQG